MSLDIVYTHTYVCTLNVADRSHLHPGMSHVRVSDLYVEFRQEVYCLVVGGPEAMLPKATGFHH